MSDYLQFKGLTQIFEDNLSNNLLYGTVDFFKWASLNAGGFSNVTITPPISGAYGGSRYRLRPVNDPRYTNGQVWEGFRPDWVWETGVNYSYQPIHISGIFINNTFISNNSGYYINYPQGQVVFTTPISTTSIVNAEFSYRTVSFKSITNNIVPDLFFNSYNVEGTYLSTSGSRSQIADLKRNLPLVGVDINTNRRFSPSELGGGQWCYLDAIFYVLAESDTDKNALIDMISLQNDKTFWIYNRSVMKSGEFFPPDLDYRGTLVDSPTQYPELIDKYAWRKISSSQTRSYTATSLPYNLHGGIVKTTFIILMGNI